MFEFSRQNHLTVKNGKVIYLLQGVSASLDSKLSFYFCQKTRFFIITNSSQIESLLVKGREGRRQR